MEKQCGHIQYRLVGKYIGSEINLAFKIKEPGAGAIAQREGVCLTCGQHRMGPGSNPSIPYSPASLQGVTFEQSQK